MPPNGLLFLLIVLPIASNNSNNFCDIIDTSSTTKISVSFQLLFRNRFFIIFVTSWSKEPVPSPMPAQEWSVLALHSNKTAAQPVSAQTWILEPFLEASFCRYFINAVLPVPPGPVTNTFLPWTYAVNALICSSE